MANINDGRPNIEERQTDMRGSPPGDSLVLPDQGVALGIKTPCTGDTARKAAGLTAKPISAQAEARQPAVLYSGHGRGGPFSHSNSHFRVIGHLGLTE